eukprot:gene5221-10450_t
MMAMISPALEAIQETLSTLKFANRAKNIRNEAKVNEDLDQKSLLRKYELELKRLRAELEAKSKNVVDKRKLLELDEQRRRAEADKMAAIRALESRSLEFLKEKEEKKRLEQRISTLMSQMIRGEKERGALGDGGPDVQLIVKQHQEKLRQEYEDKLADLERERETIEEERAQVDRYKQLLLKQRDIMIALTQRLVERDEQIMALQDELDIYDNLHKNLQENLDEKTTDLIKLQRIAMEVNARSTNVDPELTRALEACVAEQHQLSPNDMPVALRQLSSTDLYDNRSVDNYSNSNNNDEYDDGDGDGDASTTSASDSPSDQQLQHQLSSSTSSLSMNKGLISSVNQYSSSNGYPGPDAIRQQTQSQLLSQNSSHGSSYGNGGISPSLSISNGSGGSSGISNGIYLSKSKGDLSNEIMDKAEQIVTRRLEAILSSIMKGSNSSSNNSNGIASANATVTNAGNLPLASLSSSTIVSTERDKNLIAIVKQLFQDCTSETETMARERLMLKQLQRLQDENESLIKHLRQSATSVDQSGVVSLSLPPLSNIVNGGSGSGDPSMSIGNIKPLQDRCEALTKERGAVLKILEQKVQVLVESVVQATGLLLRETNSGASSGTNSSSSATTTAVSQALAKDLHSLQRLVRESVMALKNVIESDKYNGTAPAPAAASSPNKSYSLEIKNDNIRYNTATITNTNNNTAIGDFSRSTPMSHKTSSTSLSSMSNSSTPSVYGSLDSGLSSAQRGTVILSSDHTPVSTSNRVYGYGNLGQNSYSNGSSSSSSSTSNASNNNNIIGGPNNNLNL